MSVDSLLLCSYVLSLVKDANDLKMLTKKKENEHTLKRTICAFKMHRIIIAHTCLLAGIVCRKHSEGPSSGFPLHTRCEQI